MIDQEKAFEFQQVAALVCMDIDILVDVAANKSLTADELRDMILYIKEQKDELTTNKAVRDMRFGAASSIFGAIESGMIRSVAAVESGS